MASDYEKYMPLGAKIRTQNLKEHPIRFGSLSEGVKKMDDQMDDQRRRRRMITIFRHKLNRRGRKEFDGLLSRVDEYCERDNRTKSRILLEALSMGLRYLERQADLNEAMSSFEKNSEHRKPARKKPKLSRKTRRALRAADKELTNPTGETLSQNLERGFDRRYEEIGL